MPHLALADWESLPPLPEPAAGFMAGMVKGKIIVAGGTNWRDGTKRWLDTVWVFDPATSQWSHGPKLPHSLAYAGCASDGTRLYFAGGADGRQGRKEVHALDAGLKLTHIADLPQPVVFGGACLCDGKLCVFGGTPDPDDWSKGGNQLQRVNLAAGTTTALASLKQFDHAIGIPVVIAAKNSLLTFTGAWTDAEAQAHNAAAAFQHDLTTDTWRTLAPYPEAIRGVAGIMLDEQHVYLAGGYGTDAEGFIARAYLYDLRTNQYTPAKPLPLAINTTLVKGGEFIYLLGGEDQMKHRSAACYRIRVSELLP